MRWFLSSRRAFFFLFFWEIALLGLRTFTLAVLRCRGRTPEVGHPCPLKENKTLRNTEEPQTQRSAKPQKKPNYLRAKVSPNFPIWRILTSPGQAELGFSTEERRIIPFSRSPAGLAARHWLGLGFSFAFLVSSGWKRREEMWGLTGRVKPLVSPR